MDSVTFRLNIGTVEEEFAQIWSSFMVEYEIRRSQRRCSITDRPFEPGERYVSALLEIDDGYQRLDFSIDQWNDPSDDCIGWWHSKVPAKSPDRVYWAPNDVLLAYFEHLHARQPESTTTFVMGIALVRRKILRMEPNESVEGRTFMVLETHDSEKQFRVPLLEPSEEEINTIQQQLNEQLFTDQATDGGG